MLRANDPRRRPGASPRTVLRGTPMRSHLSRRQFLGTAAAAAGALAAPAAFAAEAKKKLVLLAGPPSHGPGQHEFNAGCLLLKKCLEKTPGLEVVVQLNGWPRDEKVFDGASAILCFADGGAGHPFIKG